MMIATIITTAVNYGVLNVTAEYLSVYTREKWDKHDYVRYCMIDSLNEQYELVGMTEQKLKEVLGEPTRIVEYVGNTKYKGHTVYQYIVGDDFTDPHFYNFIFDNCIVVDTSFSQH